jgi:DNA-binding MarR family transcriptional regulator
MSDAQPPAPPESSDLTPTARDLNSGAIHLLRALRVVDREAGLTPARLSALSVLVFGGPATLGRLAHAEDVAGPTMSRIVDGLAELGLAQRAPHPDNARMTIVTATAEGEALMHAAANRRFEEIIRALNTLPAADRHALVQAAPALRRLASAVRNHVSGHD